MKTEGGREGRKTGFRGTDAALATSGISFEIIATRGQYEEMPMSLSGKSVEREAFCVKQPPLLDFLNLPSGAGEHFNSIAQQTVHSSGSIVFKEGGPAEDIYVICAGMVKLFTTASDGHKVILKIAKLGDVLGLSAMLNDLPYDVTAQTLIPCHFQRVGQHGFLHFLKTHAEAAYTAARMLAKEHRELVSGTRRLGLSHSAAARVAHILVDFASSEGSTKLAPCFPMVLTHAELASLAVASRETVTRLLNQFERDGIISRDDSMITILKPAQLKQLAH